MGVAALVLGIISTLIAIIPFCGSIAIIPALIGAGLGIADIIVKDNKKQPAGLAIAGLILNVIAMFIIVGWFYLLMGGR